MAEQSLKDKTVKGTFWSAADAFLGHGVTFVVGLVLARLLTPSEYGLIGIVLIFITVFNCIIDSGFSTALIRKKEVSNKDYNTMFFTNMAISLMLFVILWFSAPLIALFFERPELVKLTRVMGLALIFQALSIVQNTILTKRLDFKTRTKASVISAMISGCVGISMAYLGFGVWSLVGQQLSNKFVYSMSLWALNHWWPKLDFSKHSFVYMWSFGWKMMVSGLLDNIWNQLNQVVVGKYYSPATLGQYARSTEYANLFSSNFSAVIQRVTFPVLAEVQDEKERMISAYRRIIKLTMFVTLMSLFFMGAVAEPLIYTLIGPQWHEAATYLPFITLMMSFFPLHAINLNMLKVQGRSDIFLVLEIIKKIINVGPLIMGIFIGIYWMLIGSIVANILSFFLNSFYTGKSLGYSSFHQLKDISPSFIIALLVAISVYFLKYLPFNNYLILVIQIVTGSVVFFMFCRISGNNEYKEIVGIIKSILKRYSHANSTR